MYYSSIVFGIIVIIVTIVSLGNITRLAIRLFKGLSDKKTVIKGTFITALTAWMFIFFGLLLWQGNEFLEPKNVFTFFPIIVFISLILAFISVLPFIYWKDRG